jgi:hypothetical protein
VSQSGGDFRYGGTCNDIFRAKQSGLLVRAGWTLPWAEPLTPREQLLKNLYETSTRVEDDDAPDSFTHEDRLEYLQTHSPRALFVGYGERDDWAHAGKYDLVLQAAHEDDQRIAELWRTMQAKPEYHDQVTFIITCDHGRGSGLKHWRNHDKKYRRRRKYLACGDGAGHAGYGRDDERSARDAEPDRRDHRAIVRLGLPQRSAAGSTAAADSVRVEDDANREVVRES